MKFFSQEKSVPSDLKKKNIAMENGPFIDGLPFLKMVDLSMANC